MAGSGVLPDMRTLALGIVTALTVVLLGPALSPPAGAVDGSCHRTRPAYPEIRPGTESGAVRTLQCVLNDAGHGPVTVDGVYGPETQAAVDELTGGFECCIRNPLRVRTWYWTILFSQSHELLGLEPGDSGIRVKTLQRALRADGETVVIDGDFGPQTRDQVKVFQDKCGLAKTGRVNGRTAFHLNQGGCNG
jgi:peptidoglycan hydrolase-like protein with peptidoglycan-binding domain